MPDRVLVTGGAGYIGSVLVPSLLAEGFEVTVLDNFRYGQSSLLDCCAHPQFQVIRGDCRDQQVLGKAMRDADYLFPLAALVGAPVCREDTIAATTVNLDAIRLLLSLRSPQQRIIFPCTNSGYGIGEKEKYCTEESPLRPISLYGQTKVQAERALLDAGNAVSLRLATVFGVSPRMRLDLLVNDFLYRLPLLPWSGRTPNGVVQPHSHSLLLTSNRRHVIQRVDWMAHQLCRGWTVKARLNLPWRDRRGGPRMNPGKACPGEADVEPLCRYTEIVEILVGKLRRDCPARENRDAPPPESGDQMAAPGDPPRQLRAGRPWWMPFRLILA